METTSMRMEGRVRTTRIRSRIWTRRSRRRPFLRNSLEPRTTETWQLVRTLAGKVSLNFIS